jgi:hypothetical protein
LVLSDLNRELMNLVFGEGLIRMDQLPRLLQLPSGKVEREVEYLVKHKCLESEPILVRDRGRPWAWPTEKGVTEFGYHMRYFRSLPALERVPHTFSVIETRLFCASEWPDGIWIPEREIPRPGPKTKRKRHPVDAILELDGKRIAIEVELTRKRPADRKRILSHLVANYDEVFYFCSSLSRPGIEASRKQTRRAGKVHVFNVPGEILWLGRVKRCKH